MSRSLLLFVLLGGYGMVFVRLPGVGSAYGFDPLSARGRQVEHAIETHRFADALPAALDLQKAFADEPVIAYWLAEIYRGLGRGPDEIAAWEAFVRLGVAPVEACPALPEAYARAGDAERALAQFERCVEYDPEDPARLIDLADAYVRQHRHAEAQATYGRAAALDPGDPAVRLRLEALSKKTGGS